MPEEPHSPAQRLVDALKECLTHQALKYAILGDENTRALNRIAQGSSVTSKALAKLAEAVSEVARQAESDPLLKERPRYTRFGEAFAREITRMLGRSFTSLSDVDQTRDAFHQIAFPAEASNTAADTSNPFFWRGAITEPGAFFGRIHEARQLRTFLGNGQSVQISGECRIGKTSLLRSVELWARGEYGPQVFAFVDMQDPSCQSLGGLLSTAAAAWGWATSPTDCVALSQAVREAIAQRRRLILALDECDRFVTLARVFTQEFFEALRFASNTGPGAGIGLTVLTSSQRTLREICAYKPITSPVWNTFAPLRLGRFTPEESRAFITWPRPGFDPFTPQEIEVLVEFGENHPLRLQVAAYFAIEARRMRTDWKSVRPLAEEECCELRPRCS